MSAGTGHSAVNKNHERHSPPPYTINKPQSKRCDEYSYATKDNRYGSLPHRKFHNCPTIRQCEDTQICAELLVETLRGAFWLWSQAWQYSYPARQSCYVGFSRCYYHGVHIHRFYEPPSLSLENFLMLLASICAVILILACIETGNIALAVIIIILYMLLLINQLRQS